MSYDKKSIKEIVFEYIEASKMYLPAIQRKFVWKKEKIENLFDSITRNYPIGTFLFWDLKKGIAKDYTFYEFLKKYDEREPYNVRKTGAFSSEKIIGVLDGQQRLSSLYIGLQGTHKNKLKNKKKINPDAYPEKILYVNLLSLAYKEIGENIEIDSEKDFEFKFLTKDEAKQVKRNTGNEPSSEMLWFKVGEVLDWNQDPEIDDKYDNLLLNNESIKNSIRENKRFIKKFLRVFYERICKDQLINYFTIIETELDSVLKIFIRVNSGATVLSRTDLLFSTIVATWEEGREEIEVFLKHINSVGDGFNFNNDFLMRSCLVLSDLEVLFKVKSFKTENVQLIKDNWEGIKVSLIKTIDLLMSYGFNSKNLASQNSILIIAYYFMIGGQDSESSKKGIHSYIIKALLKNIYGGQGDQIISVLRKSIKENNDKKIFPIESILNTRLPSNKSLKIDEDDIDDFLNQKKGSKTFLTLSILYPNRKFNMVRYQQDHIHPYTGFENKKLLEAKIPKENWEKWQLLKDTLPNLQLLESSQNASKNDIPLKKWLDGSNNKISDMGKYLEENYIPDTERDFSNFYCFYEERKKLIKAKLIEASKE